MDRKFIFCCGCEFKVHARLTRGSEIYPHRKDLEDLPFWKCDKCGNYVGCHNKTRNKTRPLGYIPTPELRNARRHIHALIDPLWKEGHVKRTHLYSLITDKIGKEYHTANIQSLEEARDIYKICLGIKKDLINK